MNKVVELVLAIVLLVIGWKLEKLAREMDEDEEEQHMG